MFLSFFQQNKILLDFYTIITVYRQHTKFSGGDDGVVFVLLMLQLMPLSAVHLMFAVVLCSKNIVRKERAFPCKTAGERVDVTATLAF